MVLRCSRWHSIKYSSNRRASSSDSSIQKPMLTNPTDRPITRIVVRTRNTNSKTVTSTPQTAKTSLRDSAFLPVLHICSKGAPSTRYCPGTPTRKPAFHKRLRHHRIDGCHTLVSPLSPGDWGSLSFLAPFRYPFGCPHLCAPLFLPPEVVIACWGPSVKKLSPPFLEKLDACGGEPHSVAQPLPFHECNCLPVRPKMIEHTVRREIDPLHAAQQTLALRFCHDRSLACWGPAARTQKQKAPRLPLALGTSRRNGDLVG